METEYLGMSGLQIGIQWFFISICIGLVIFSPFFLLELRKVRKAKESIASQNMKVEISEIVDDVINFYAEVSYIDGLRCIRCAALEKIKAICGHLGVQVKICGLKMNPSIDIIRSLSFMKEYLPEIEEEWKIYEEKGQASRIILDKICNKRRWMIKELHKTKSDIWNLLNSEQKRLIIHDLSEQYDREHKENQK